MIKFKFDGYEFGDRTLEGIKFIAEVDENTFEVQSISLANDKDKSYMDTLNNNYWISLALDYAQDLVDDCGLPNEVDNLKEALLDNGVRVV